MSQEEKSSTRAAADRILARPQGLDNARTVRVGHVYAENHSRLVRFLTAKLSSESEARDVAQEAYLRLLAFDDLDKVNYPKTFLYRIANNIVIDRIRKQKSSRIVQSLDDITAQVPCDRPSQEMIVAARKKLTLMSKAIDELPAKCRKAFILHKFRNMSYTEIAEVMGLTESMIRKYVARAIVYCRDRTEMGE